MRIDNVQTILTWSLVEPMPRRRGRKTSSEEPVPQTPAGRQTDTPAENNVEMQPPRYITRSVLSSSPSNPPSIPAPAPAPPPQNWTPSFAQMYSYFNASSYYNATASMYNMYQNGAGFFSPSYYPTYPTYGTPLHAPPLPIHDFPTSSSYPLPVSPFDTLEDNVLLRPIPQPSQDYLLNASLPPFRLTEPTRKLLILDLNGTLLYRPRNPSKPRYVDMRQASAVPVVRPHLDIFLKYIFSHFDVMIWSSAQPKNVNSMIDAVMNRRQKKMLLDIWARDTLGLSQEEYNKKSVVFKDLERVFKRQPSQTRKKNSQKVAMETSGGLVDVIDDVQEDVAEEEDGRQTRWDITNTILLDDSLVKASLQPYNHIYIPEFMGLQNGGDQDDALQQVIGYLEELRYQGDVARFIKQRQFSIGDGWDGRRVRQ